MLKSITMEIFSKDCDEKNDDLNERRLGPIDFTIELSLLSSKITTTNTAYISTFCFKIYLFTSRHFQKLAVRPPIINF